MKFERMAPGFTEKISEMLKVLADPTRLKILQSLHGGEMSVGEMVDKIGTSQANISKHLALLQQVFLVRSEKRGLRTYYRIEDPEVDKICEAICQHYGRLVTKRFKGLAR